MVWQRSTILSVSMSSQNIVHAISGSSLIRTGVTTSEAAHRALPSNTRLKDPMKALSRGQHTHSHSHSENNLAQVPAVRHSFPSGESCTSSIRSVMSDMRSAVGVRKSTSPRSSGVCPNSNLCPMTVFVSLHSCSSGSLLETASFPSADRMKPLHSSTVAVTYDGMAGAATMLSSA